LSNVKSRVEEAGSQVLTSSTAGCTVTEAGSLGSNTRTLARVDFGPRRANLNVSSTASSRFTRAAAATTFAFGPGLSHHLRNSSAPTVFLFAAAKGDIQALDCLIQTAAPVDRPPVHLGLQASLVQRSLGLPAARAMVISNACASGSIAVETAVRLMRDGVCGRAVVFGFDTVSRFVATGFHGLGALSTAPARPCDRDRSGLSLGDGAAVAVLEWREPRAGDLVVAGAGSSNDANHRTGPSRTGEGLFRAAAACLADAASGPEPVGGVKCHGTATVYNDAMEAKALHTLFRGHPIPPVVSLKGALGHTSGGGSLLELLVAGRLLKERTLPGTVGFVNPGTDEPLPVAPTPQPLAGSSVLCLSAGFGGVNAAILLKEHA